MSPSAGIYLHKDTHIAASQSPKPKTVAKATIDLSEELDDSDTTSRSDDPIDALAIFKRPKIVTIDDG